MRVFFGLIRLSFGRIFGKFTPVEQVYGGFDATDASGEPKVTNLDAAVFVDEDVGGLEVSVEYVGRVEVLDGAK